MPNPRENRLRIDFEKVHKLTADSGGTLKLISWSGSPPDHYVVEYHCPSWVRYQDSKAEIGGVHLVEIRLGSAYPLEKAVTAFLLTPIFNPHVFSHGEICLGNQWSVTETLDNLILRIGALLQLDPKVLNFDSPANREATQLAQKTLQLLPLGSVTFRAIQQPRSRITWG